MAGGQRRPPIPDSIKDLVWAREGGVCQICKAPIADRSQAQFDHRPPLSARPRNHQFKPTNPRHYIPHANADTYIELVHSAQTSAEKCHEQRTSGPLGMQMRGDTQNAARVKRILDKQNGNGKAKPKMQSRPFDKRKRPMPGSRAHPSKQRKAMSGKVGKWE